MSRIKRISVFLFIAFVAVSCGQTSKLPTKDDSKEEHRVVIGISRSGIAGKTVECFIKCITDAGADYYFFPQYPETDELLRQYLGSVDALIVPGKSSKDTVNRKKYDDRTIKMALSMGKPVLGICFGHQRINASFGGTIKKVTDYYPDSRVSHKYFDKDGNNAGLHCESHSITIDRDSRLFRTLGCDSVMVNTSHYYSNYDIGEGLKVVARSADGVVEAIEGDNVTGVQFHPEYLYGEMNLTRFLSIFKALVEQAEASADKTK